LFPEEVSAATMSDDSNKPFAVASGETMLFMTKMIRGGIVFSSDLAQKLAEVLCEAHYGERQLVRQKPLSVTDKDTFWRVEGNWNRDGKLDGPGAFFVSIDKYDGRVTDFGQLYPYRAHPSVVPTIKQHLKRKKSDQGK
jgi:NTF2 fold immunity protein of polymorphic toxin system component